MAPALSSHLSARLSAGMVTRPEQWLSHCWAELGPVSLLPWAPQGKGRGKVCLYWLFLSHLFIRFGFASSFSKEEKRLRSKSWLQFLSATTATITFRDVLLVELQHVHVRWSLCIVIKSVFSLRTEVFSFSLKSCREKSLVSPVFKDVRYTPIVSSEMWKTRWALSSPS